MGPTEWASNQASQNGAGRHSTAALTLGFSKTTLFNVTIQTVVLQLSAGRNKVVVDCR